MPINLVFTDKMESSESAMKECCKLPGSVVMNSFLFITPDALLGKSPGFSSLGSSYIQDPVERFVTSYLVCEFTVFEANKQVIKSNV